VKLVDKETQAKLEGLAVAAGLAALAAILQYFKDNLPAYFPGASWLPVAGVAIAAVLAVISQNQRWLNTPSKYHISAPSLSGMISAVAPAVEQAVIAEAEKPSTPVAPATVPLAGADQAPQNGWPKP